MMLITISCRHYVKYLFRLRSVKYLFRLRREWHATPKLVARLIIYGLGVVR